MMQLFEKLPMEIRLAILIFLLMQIENSRFVSLTSHWDGTRMAFLLFTLLQCFQRRLIYVTNVGLIIPNDL